MEQQGTFFRMGLAGFLAVAFASPVGALTLLFAHRAHQSPKEKDEASFSGADWPEDKPASSRRPTGVRPATIEASLVGGYQEGHGWQGSGPRSRPELMLASEAVVAEVAAAVATAEPPSMGVPLAGGLLTAGLSPWGLATLGVASLLEVEGTAISLKSAPPDLQQRLRKEMSPFWKVFVEGLTFVVVSTYVAVIYKYTRVEPPPRQAGVRLKNSRFPDQFEYGLFDTTECDLELAFCSICCWCLRWTDTASSRRFNYTSFWRAFFAFSLLCGFRRVLWPLWLGLVIIIRQKLRAHYGMQRGDCQTYCEDCLAWTFCSCCAMAQEAKQVELVRNVGVPDEGLL